MQAAELYLNPLREDGNVWHEEKYRLYFPAFVLQQGMGKDMEPIIES